MSDLALLSPDWQVAGRVRAFVATRSGGVSSGPWASLNCAYHVGDDDSAVGENRRRLLSALPGKPALHWLNQVHGDRVLSLNHVEDGPPATADALCTHQADLGLCVLTADCLPVFLADVEGEAVALAHAGWRGLAAGVLANTVAALQLPPQRLRAWLGPAIGPCHFEVGAEVRAEFVTRLGSEVDSHFSAQPGDKYLADLYGLARLALGRAGVERVSGGGFCTHCDSRRFFSYRRDGETGRLASVIYLQG